MTNAINTTETTTTTTTTHWEASGNAGDGGLGSVIDDTMQALHTLLINLEANCFEESISDPSPPSTAPWCSRVWDGLLCWPPTPANVTSHLSCPAYIDGFNILAAASRHCTEDGTWFFNVQQNRSWTNYSSCGYATMHHPTNHMNTTLIETWLPVIKRVSQIGYSVSLVVLLIALCILASFKKLYCPRNTLHMHLFISFIMRAFMAILKGNLYSKDLDDIASAAAGIHTSQSDQHEINLASAAAVDSFQDYSTSWECKVVTAFWQYFIMANYSWILMEGLYLHNLIFMALFTDSSAITMYIILGWGLPLCFVALWVAMRVVYANHMCWTTNEHDWIFWIIRGPITASILINFVFFVHITWVLLSKLRSSVSAETRKYRKWAKSTLVLVPLFGVHYTVFCGMQGAVGLHEAVEVVWLFCDQLFASFQGFLVALLYCLMNGEVRGELARRWNRFRQNHRMESPWSQYSITNNSRTNTTRWRTSFHSIQITSVGDRRDMRLRSLTPPLVAGCYDSSRSISNPSSLHNSTSCINSATTTAAAVGAPTSVSRRGSAGGILGNGLLARPSAIANNRLEKIVSESEESEQVEIFGRPLAAEPPPPQPSADSSQKQQHEVISLDCMSPLKPESIQSSQSKTTL